MEAGSLDPAIEEALVLNRTSAAVLGFVIAVGCFATTSAQAGRRYINARSASDPASATQPPFSGAVVVGNTAYLSGVLGTGDTPEAAATTGLNNLKAALTASGMTMDDLVFVQVFSPDVATNYDPFNKVYRGMFKQEFPARAFIGSGTLIQNAKYEVLGIAVKR
jgi:enamine deaminase RidA (YjgF/YER057c/UK114 family)